MEKQGGGGVVGFLNFRNEKMKKIIMRALNVRESEKPISKVDLDLFIDSYRLKIPDSYKQFILKNNGGYPKFSAYGNSYEDGFVIDVFSCFDTEYDRYSSSVGKQHSKVFVFIWLR